MTEAKEARHHDLDIGLQLTCRCVGSGEPGQTADATAIAVDKGGQSLCDERVATGFRENFERQAPVALDDRDARNRSEEHTSELQSLMRISYAVFCLKKKRSRKRQYLNHEHYTYLIKHSTQYSNTKRQP